MGALRLEGVDGEVDEGGDETPPSNISSTSCKNRLTLDASGLLDVSGGIKALHFRFDPSLDFAHQFIGISTFAGNGLAN